MEKTQVMVYFSMFADEFPLNAVTKQLGIEPTESYKKGDIIKKISPTENYVRSYTCWKLSTGYQESLDVGEQMDMIIDQIGDKSAIINDLKRQFELAGLPICHHNEQWLYTWIIFRSIHNRICK